MNNTIKVGMLCIFLMTGNVVFSQNSKEAKALLDEVSTKMTAYKNMFIDRKC